MDLGASFTRLRIDILQRLHYDFGFSLVHVSCSRGGDLLTLKFCQPTWFIGQQCRVLAFNTATGNT